MHHATPRNTLLRKNSRPNLRLMTAMVAIAAGSAGMAVPNIAAAQAPAPDALVNALEGTFGKQAGARRSGAKGICAEGFIVGTPEGRALSKSAIFGGSEVPVVARFSVGGGNPKASDKGKTVRGLALSMKGPGGEAWQMANISAPVFFVNKPENFVKFLEARKPDPATGRPDPAKVKAFNDSHPDAKPQIDWLAKAPVPASYAAVNYWGANAFEFTDAKGKKVFGKWSFEPAKGQEGLTDEQLKNLPDDFLADELRKRVAASTIAFDFKVQIAEAGDVVNDATVPLPANRKVVTAGRLVIDKVEAGAGGKCDKITFNPLVLPKGVGPSADPTLIARPASYAVSLGRRLPDQK
jgi:catalase